MNLNSYEFIDFRLNDPPPRRVVLSEKSGKLYLEANDRKLQVVLFQGGMYREGKTHEVRKTQKPRQSVVVIYNLQQWSPIFSSFKEVLGGACSGNGSLRKI